MEHEPKVVLSFENGHDIEATRDNTMLYTYLGAQAIYNHIFVVKDDEGAQAGGAYIFSDLPVFGEIRDYMQRNDFTQYLNMRDVAECDKQAYERHIKKLCGNLDTVPEEWV